MTDDPKTYSSSAYRRPAKTEIDLDAPGPVVILVEPQLGENIGMVARAMLNNGLVNLRIVKPRDGWPNDAAIKTSSGAVAVLDRAQIFETTEDAVKDLTHVYATTARSRDMSKDVVTPNKAAQEMVEMVRAGERCGVLFGRENVGLLNEEVALADSILQVPLNPAFSSLNLAQAVLLMGYEWYQTQTEQPDTIYEVRLDTRRATKDELIGMFEHLEGALEDCNFITVKEKKPIVSRNLRNMFQRARLTEQEVRTFRGIITCLGKPRPKKQKD